MKRFIKAAPLTIVTFIIGVFVTLAWPRSESIISTPLTDHKMITIYEPVFLDTDAAAGVTLDPKIKPSCGLDEFYRRSATGKLEKPGR